MVAQIILLELVSTYERPGFESRLGASSQVGLRGDRLRCEYFINKIFKKNLEGCRFKKNILINIPNYRKGTIDSLQMNNVFVSICRKAFLNCVQGPCFLSFQEPLTRTNTQITQPGIIGDGVVYL